MPFIEDTHVIKQVAPVYGNYHSTFRSATGQIEALLFERNGWLMAYISFPTGVKLQDVTDTWSSDLKRYAIEHGFENRMRLVYTY